MTKVVDPQVARALDRLHAAASDLVAIRLVPTGADDAKAVIRGLESGVRIASAAQMDLLGEVDGRAFTTQMGTGPQG